MCHGSCTCDTTRVEPGLFPPCGSLFPLQSSRSCVHIELTRSPHCRVVSDPTLQHCVVREPRGHRRGLLRPCEPRDGGIEREEGGPREEEEEGDLRLHPVRWTSFRTAARQHIHGCTRASDCALASQCGIALSNRARPSLLSIIRCVLFIGRCSKSMHTGKPGWSRSSKTGRCAVRGPPVTAATPAKDALEIFGVHFTRAVIHIYPMARQRRGYTQPPHANMPARAQAGWLSQPASKEPAASAHAAAPERRADHLAQPHRVSAAISHGESLMYMRPSEDVLGRGRAMCTAAVHTSLNPIPPCITACMRRRRPCISPALCCAYVRYQI